MSARGKEEEKGTVPVNKYSNYINYDLEVYNSLNSDATKKINFTMHGAYNSFLRTETTALSDISSNITDINEYTVLPHVTTSNTTQYSNNNSLSNGRKREGNYIETFTNKEIRDNSHSNFIEASAIDRSKHPLF